MLWTFTGTPSYSIVDVWPSPLATVITKWCTSCFGTDVDGSSCTSKNRYPDPPGGNVTPSEPPARFSIVGRMSASMVPSTASSFAGSSVSIDVTWTDERLALSTCISYARWTMPSDPSTGSGLARGWNASGESTAPFVSSAPSPVDSALAGTAASATSAATASAHHPNLRDRTFMSALHRARSRASSHGVVSDRAGRVHLPQFGRASSPDAITEAAQLAEQLGFADVWVSDHIAIPAAQDYPSPYLYDPLLTLTWAAAATERVGLGTSVLVVPQHPPLALANSLASLDALSGGRLTIGAGVGWSEAEFAALGQSFADRGRRMDEMLDVLRACWGPDPVDFHGEFVHLDAMKVQPKPAHPIPIWIGGRSEPAFRRAARAATASTPSVSTPKARRGSSNGCAASGPRSRSPSRCGPGGTHRAWTPKSSAASATSSRPPASSTS